MIFSIVCNYILHNFCFEDEEITISCGYLCEGDIKNHQIPLKNVYCRLESFVHEGMLESHLILNNLQDKDLTSYNCIIFDDNKKFWWENYDDYVFYLTFIFEKDDVSLKVSYPFTRKNKSKLEGNSVKKYEMNVYKLSLKFFKLAIEIMYRNDNFMELKKSYEIRLNSNSTNHNFKGITTDKIQAQNIFAQQLIFLEKLYSEGSTDLKNLSNNLKKFYSVEKIKYLLCNNQINKNEEDMNKICMYMIDESHEFFQQKESIDRNNLKNSSLRLSLMWSKVLIIELNMVNLKITNPKADKENYDIKRSDIIFKNEYDKIMEVPSKFVLITREVKPNHIHIIVNLSTLIIFKVKSFSIMNLGISKTIDWNDLIKTENKSL